jgi:hypothetical protein
MRSCCWPRGVVGVRRSGNRRGNYHRTSRQNLPGLAPYADHFGPDRGFERELFGMQLLGTLSLGSTIPQHCGQFSNDACGFLQETFSSVMHSTDEVWCLHGGWT